MVRNTHRRTKITVVIGSLDRGGAETHLMRTLPMLDSSKYDVEVLTFGRRGGMADQMEALGVKVLGPWFEGARILVHRRLRIIRAAIALLRVFCNFFIRRPDIVHFFLPESYLIAGPAALLAGVKRCVMSRRSLNQYFDRKPRYVKKIELWLHSKMSAILANSQVVAEQLIHQEKCDHRKVILLHNGVDVDFGKGERSLNFSKEFGVFEGEVTIVMTANLIEYKGHHDLLDACAELKHLNWRLLLVGKGIGSVENALMQQAQRSGIGQRVRFLGGRSDVQKILPHCDIGVLVSHEEGFSNAIIEYMASGLPVVATCVGGNLDAVVDGETGILVPAQNPKAIACALEVLIEDKVKRLSMGRRGEERVAQNFSQGKCVLGYEKIYDELSKKEPHLSDTGLLASDYMLNNM